MENEDLYPNYGYGNEGDDLLTLIKGLPLVVKEIVVQRYIDYTPKDRSYEDKDQELFDTLTAFCKTQPRPLNEEYWEMHTAIANLEASYDISHPSHSYFDIDI